MVKKKSPFKKGYDFLSGSKKTSQFVSIGPDETVQIVPLVPLDELISVDMHEFWDVNPAVFLPCLGDDCPSCKTGNDPKFKAYLPVLLRDGAVKVYAFGISVARQMSDIESEVPVEGTVLKVKRTGSGLKTRYTLIPTGNKVDTEVADEMPDVEALLGPTTVEGAIDALIEGGVIDEDDPRFEKPKKVVKKRAPRSKPVPEPEEEEEEEGEGEGEDDDDGWGDV